jgi:cytoskeletal protein CcmA (bactofilin family)
MLRKAASSDPFGTAPEGARATADEFAAGDAPAPEAPEGRSTSESSGGGNTVTREPRSQSVIDGQSSFDGKFESGQDLVVLGSISGEIVCRGVLTIERDATAKAKIESRDAQIRGRLEGDLVCSGRCVIASTANVNGTVKASALVVEEGATIRGSIETISMGALESAPGAARVPARKVVNEAPPAEDASNGGTGANTRWTGRREVPTFALVSSEERTSRGN